MAKGKVHIDLLDGSDKKMTFSKPSGLSDWVRADGYAAASIRATTDCVLATGLPSPLEVESLRRRFPRDFTIIEGGRNSAGDRPKNSKKSPAEKVGVRKDQVMVRTLGGGVYEDKKKKSR